MQLTYHLLLYCGGHGACSGQYASREKREQTKVASFEAAVELFEARGYDETTIADIAAAGIAARTFFSYLTSKDELEFGGAETRIGAAYAAIAERRPDHSAAEVLLRSLGDAIEAGHDYGGS